MLTIGNFSLANNQIGHEGAAVLAEGLKNSVNLETLGYVKH